MKLRANRRFRQRLSARLNRNLGQLNYNFTD